MVAVFLISFCNFSFSAVGLNDIGVFKLAFKTSFKTVYILASEHCLLRFFVFGKSFCFLFAGKLVYSLYLFLCQGYHSFGSIIPQNL